MRSRWQEFRERPEDWTLDPHHELAKGLVFAGLGGGRGSEKFLDASGYGNSGTLTNMDPATDWVWDSTLGRFANRFVDTNDIIALPDAAFRFQEFSVGAWVYRTGSAPGYGMFICDNGGGDSGYSIYLASGNLLSFSTYIAGWSTLSSASALPANQWVHCLATRTADGSRVLYQDGVVVGSDTHAGTITGWPLRPAIGNGYIGGGGIFGPAWGAASSQFRGSISDPVWWSRVVSASEAAALADPSNVLLSGLILPPARKLWAAVSAGPGGNTYEESLSLNLAAGFSAASAAILESSLTMAVDANLAAGSVATLQSALSFSAAADCLIASDLTAAAALSLAITAAYQAGSDLSAESAMDIAAAAGFSAAGGLNLNESLSFSVSNSLAVAAAKIAQESFALGVTADLTSAGRLIAESRITAGITAQIATLSQLLAESAIALGAEADLAVRAGQDYEEALTLAVAVQLLATPPVNRNVIRFVLESLTKPRLTNESITVPKFTGEALSYPRFTNESLES